MRRLTVCAGLLCSAISVAGAFGQTPPKQSTATCTFDDGKQMSVRYNTGVSADKREPSKGKVWAPGESPMTLFTQTDLMAGSTRIPTDAYSLYLIPGEKDWTLIVNKGVKPGSPYDEQQDLLRTTMEIGQVNPPEKELHVSFAHVAPKQCNLRVYYGGTGTWAEFREK
ncbi:MAG TPA: DUF2911 domain-containing protein [Candidatus Sulfotelmatobacter sp.]|nr:DUF2911 domain-containing protein [Candidatus Sulfotelmatobacter sp.]